MRTFGICISAKEGEQVKAVADGKVIDIVDDSSTLKSDIPYVAKTVIIDHGNGYITRYGFQNGKPDKDLLGKIVKAGDILGIAGKPTGAFIKQGGNIYLQAMHNEEIIDPLKLLDYKQASANVETEAVDMGHTSDDAE
jgi:murein DD-endopeptidase MepM/ murein hydrolase activator NlpD